MASLHLNSTQAAYDSDGKSLFLVSGGGVTQIVMPYLAQGIEKHTYSFRAWRWAFFFPGCLQIIWGLMILKFSQVSYPKLATHLSQVVISIHISSEFNQCCMLNFCFSTSCTFFLANSYSP